MNGESREISGRAVFFGHGLREFIRPLCDRITQAAQHIDTLRLGGCCHGGKSAFRGFHCGPCIIGVAKPDIADFFFRCRIEKVQPFIAVWHHKFTVDIDVFN
ncbi:hypothetical protein D3C78_1249040 [compost metagenome]